jgi:hypothetical protein
MGANLPVSAYGSAGVVVVVMVMVVVKVMMVTVMGA